MRFVRGGGLWGRGWFLRLLLEVVLLWGFVGARGSLREIPEVVSARKPLRGNGR